MSYGAISESSTKAAGIGRSGSNQQAKDIIRYTNCEEHCFNACVLKV